MKAEKLCLFVFNFLAVYQAFNNFVKRVESMPECIQKSLAKKELNDLRNLILAEKFADAQIKVPYISQLVQSGESQSASTTGVSLFFIFVFSP